MCQKLPYEKPQFDNEIKKYAIDFILSLDPNGDYCYIFNVDIHYPNKLHDRDTEFPILSEQDIPPNDKTKKLMSTFYDYTLSLKNYTISLINLQYCLKKGLELKKKHHVVHARQTDFMKSYIEFNNKKRTECSKNKDRFGVE